jgi:polar amino acid transport system permease protein
VSCPKTITKKPYFAIGLNITLIFLAISLACYAVFSFQVYDWKAVYAYRSVFFTGWMTTCQISLCSLMLSLILGTLTALLRRSNILILRYLGNLYVEIIRGTPLLVQLLLFFYVIASFFHVENRFLVGILTLSLFSGAYIAEIVRSGIDSIRVSHLDSAKAIGMTKSQTYQFVIFPLAFRQCLPPLTGQFASIIKDSSLLSIIGISELTYSAQQISSATYSTLESYFPLALGYLILTLPISQCSKYIEKKFKYES